MLSRRRILIRFAVVCFCSICLVLLLSWKRNEIWRTAKGHVDINTLLHLETHDTYNDRLQEPGDLRYARGDVERARYWLNHSLVFPMRSEMNTTVFESVGDGLSEECVRRHYGNLHGWPRASVIIPFVDNEKIEDLLHTVHSIIQRTPPELLEDIILIADNTSAAVYNELLDNYCAAVFGPMVHVIRSHVTLGLIQGRLLGSRLARGDVIVTMDAHMEVQPTWLEALIYEIKQNPKTMCTATLDWMSPREKSGWKYQNGPDLYMCMFSWDLGFGFGYPSLEFRNKYRKNKTMPYPAPCSVGTIWAIDKKFFRSIGELDDGMKLWGGENLELPLRVWLFGGRVVQVPCSHAAHLERAHQRDYRYGWDSVIKRNYKRVVEVWFDGYKEHAYRATPELRDIHAGNISARLQVKKKALHDFEWFLQNVYSALGIYNNNTFAYDWVENVGLKRCLHNYAGMKLWECLGQLNKENIWLTTDGYLRTDTLFWVAQGSGHSRVFGSEGATGTYGETILSKWIHWEDGPLMVYDCTNSNPLHLNICLEGFHNKHFDFQLKTCDVTNPNQRWKFKTYSKDWSEFMERGLKDRFSSKYHKLLLGTKQKWEKETSDSTSSG